MIRKNHIVLFLAIICIFGQIEYANAYSKKKYEANEGFTDKLVVQSKDKAEGEEKDGKSEKNKEAKAAQQNTFGYKIDFIEYFDLTKCELLNPCRPCTFKEMQKWSEC